ncbi:hypothetical protein AB0I51_11315 [Streptomyces sp. NPDC050549]|uniref:hypothetical protein n=1 Tax=Streptomyces sp. NPDC050549 TaxID=3155406 RepID=UPI003422A7B2
MALAEPIADASLDSADPGPAQHDPLPDHPDMVLAPHPVGWTRRATTSTLVDAARGAGGRPPAAVADPLRNPRKATT